MSERAVGSEKEGRRQRGGEGDGFGRIRKSELGLGRQCNVSLGRRLLSVGSHSQHPAPSSPFMNPPATGLAYLSLLTHLLPPLAPLASGPSLSPHYCYFLPPAAT